MALSTPPGQPSITGTVGTSIRDAFGVIEANLYPVVAFITLGSVVGGVEYTLAWRRPAPESPTPLFFLLFGATAVLYIVLYNYAFAGAVRTLKPDFAMTPRVFFGIIGYSLVAAILTMLGTLCFIIPGYWIGVKVMLMPYTYAITGGTPDPLETTWKMTTGYYWETVGMVLLLGLALLVPSVVLWVLSFASISLPWLSIVLIPIGLAIVAWSLHAQMLANVRWTAGLLPRANKPEPVLSPA
jgi:hypothetical protein